MDEIRSLLMDLKNQESESKIELKNQVSELKIELKNQVSEVKKQADNIETQVYKQNEKIKSLEESIKEISYQSNVSRAYGSDGRATRATEYKNENFLNQMKEEIVNDDKKLISEKGSGSKVKKAASFNEKPTKKMVRVRRSPHTVPSDKDEQRRLRSFHQECLSKAIQWSLVDLLRAASEMENIVLPKWLSKEEARYVMVGTERKGLARRLLCVLIEKDFKTMQEWLQTCEFDVNVLTKVWEAFEEFSNMNRSVMKCFPCRLIENVDALDIVDYLFSADIIVRETYVAVSVSKLPIGAQEGLWKQILQDCEKYVCPDMVICALKVALTEKQRSVSEKDRPMYDSLLRDIEDTNAQDLFTCNCEERCSKLFHPVSCLKAMSLAGVYLSPPAHQRKQKSSSSEDPESSVSPRTSVETLCSSAGEETKPPKECLSSPDEQTYLKKTFETASEGNKKHRSDEKMEISKYSFQAQSKRSRSVHRRKNKQKEASHLHESSSESFDVEKNPPVQVINSVRSLALNQRLESKPNVINAQNVVINTGPQYHLKRSSTSSSEGSSVH